jgi:hypothetical protein
MPCFGRSGDIQIGETERTREKGHGRAGALEARAGGLRPASRGRRRGKRFGFVQASIVSRWREIVGARYAAVSSPESIRFPPGRKSQGVLTLIVEGAHAPVMQHVAPTIIERVNRFFGYPAVERLSFRQGTVQAEKARSRPAPPSLRPLPAELGDSLREVADPELRACLESLARGLSSGEEAPVVTTVRVVGRIGGDGKR